MKRRTFMHGAAMVAALVASPELVAQTKFPAKAITFVVPFAPGGGGDTVARLLAKGLQDRLNNPVVVENRAGAGGNIGAASVMKSPPDGHTLLNISSTYAIQAALGRPSFDPLNDMQPIIVVAREPVILVVHPAASWQNAKDLALAARKSPGTISHGSAGPGSVAHMGMEELAYRMGVQLLHVPYKGSSAAFTDLLGQNVNLVMTTVTFAMPHIKAGKVRAIGIAGSQRLSTLPDVPTFAEQGWPEYQVFDWKAVAGPKGIPADVVVQLNRELNEVLKQRAVVDKFEAEGTTLVGGTPEQMMQLVRGDVARWKTLTQKAQIKIE